MPDCCPAGPFSGSGSLHLNVTVTGELYQPLLLDARSGCPEIAGGVLSILNPDEVNGTAVFLA